MPENKRPSLISSITYKDPAAALTWLENVFGFETVMVITDESGALAHSEMRFGTGVLMIGPEWDASHCSPLAVGGKNTQMIHVYLDEDVDAHCARAKTAGATILMAPEDQFYGDRTYRTVDLEGHLWSFAQPTRVVSREEAEAASGLKIKGWI